MPRPSWLWPAVVVTVAYAAAFALLPRGGFWINDNGAKFIQMEGIVRGSYADFSVPWPGRAVDPELTYNPLHHPFGEVVGGRLLVPYSATFAVLSFIASWNSFLWPLVIISSQKLMTLPVGIANLRGEHLTAWNLVMAGTTISVIPIVVVYLFAQRHIVRGFVLSGVKG